MKQPKSPSKTALPATISTRELESLSGIGEKRLRQLATANKFPSAKDGRWETVPVIKGIISHYRAASTPDEIDRARLAKLEAETRLLEQTYAERDGKLVDYDRALEVYTRGAQAIVACVMAMTHLSIDDRETIINKMREAGQMAVQLQAEVANENKK